MNKRKHIKAVEQAAKESRAFSDLQTGMTYNFWYPIEFGVVVK